MKIFKIISFFLLFLTISTAYSQIKTDSTEQRLGQISGSQKVNLLIQLSTNHNGKSIVKMKEYGEQAITEAKKISNKILEIKAYYSLGKNYYLVAQYDKAISYLLSALKLTETTNDIEDKILIMYLIGIINRDLKNYTIASEYFNKTLREALTNHQITEYLLSRNEIGNLLLLEGKLDEALQIKKAVLKEAILKKEDFVKLCCGHDIGLIYENLGNKKQALKFYMLSNKIENHRRYPREIVIGNMSISRIYSQLKDYDKSIEFANKALELAKAYNLRKELMDLKFNISTIYASTADYEKAFENLQEASSLKDSIFNEESTKQLNELQMKYETEKKEREIEFLKKDSAAQTNLRNLLILILILIILIAIIIYRLFLFKKKTTNILEEKNEALEKTNIKLKESETELKEINSTKDTFFSIMSHDLRNPFSSIIGISELMKGDYHSLSDEEKIQFAEKINTAAKSTYHLLENLLFWASSQKGSIKVNKTSFNINKVIDEITILSSGCAKLKNIKIITETEDEEIVYADKFMTDTVIRNLVSNAIKFTSQNGQVKISSKKICGYVEIIISDTGVGISEEQLKNIFKIGSQIKTKGTSGETGSGLGLILCKEFIEKNGGSIAIKSKLNVGSNFTVCLPSINLK
jgi:signal transduction histidine kinase